MAPLERSREAYLQRLQAIRSLPEGEFKHITLDIPAAVEVALLVSARARPLFEPFSNDTTGFDPRLPDGVESYALALSHAYALHQAAIELPSTSEELVRSAVKLRQILLADINLSVLRGHLDGSVIGGLRGINGYRNLAFDLRMLVGLFKENRDPTAVRTTVTGEELDKAECLANGLIAAIAERDRAPELLARAVRDRQAAYALFVRTYDELRTAIRYLRRKHGDADVFAPTLFVRRSGSSEHRVSAPVFKGDRASCVPEGFGERRQRTAALPQRLRLPHSIHHLV